MGRPKRLWTAEELAILQGYGDPRKRPGVIRRLCRGRTLKAVATKASLLRLDSPGRRWTQSEDQALEVAMGEGWDEEKLMSRFRRPLTAIMERATKQGWRGAPQGCMSIRQASIRFGYSSHTIGRIVWWAGVPVRTLARRRKTDRINRYVETDTMAAAVDAWMQALTLGQAAREFGVDRHALSRELRRRRVRSVGAVWRVRHEVAMEAARAVQARNTMLMVRKKRKGRRAA